MKSRAEAQPRVDLESAGSSGVVSDFISTIFAVLIIIVVKIFLSSNQPPCIVNCHPHDHTMSHDLKVGGVVSVLVVIAIIVLAGALVHRLVAIMVVLVVMVIMVIKTCVILMRILQMLYFHTSHIMMDV